MNNNFVIWHYVSVRHAAIFTDFQGFDETYLLHEALPLREDFPREAAFHMNPDFPNDLLLPDNVGNSLEAVLVSQRLHAFLEAQGLGDVEYLPVAIIDHKGRVASDSHVIVHPVGPVECIDMARTACRMSEIVEGDIDDVERLVLDESRIPAGRRLFKLKGLGDPTIVIREFAQQLDAQGFSGLGWCEIDKYRT